MAGAYAHAKTHAASTMMLVASLCTGVGVVHVDEAAAQMLIDRVLARVDSAPITLTDVEAAVGLGIIQGPSGSGDLAAATQQMIDRQLELAEVQRFPPPEPPPAAVATEAAHLKANAGARLASLMQSTGLTDQRITDVARDNLRIAAYLDQRFGTAVQVSDEEVAAYYRAHEAEFTRGAEAIPFEEAAPVARQRVSAERRRGIVDQWLRDLRSRADVAINGSVTPVAGSATGAATASKP
jgi:hypothetical protein